MKSLMGVNLEAILDWDRMEILADIAKQSRQFGSADHPWDNGVAFDAKRWPSGNFGACFATSLQNPSGTWKFKAKGQIGNIGHPGSNVSVSNLSYDAATNTTSADLIVPDGVTETNIYLSFHQVTSPVQDIKLLRPGYDGSTLTTKEFRDAVAPFSVLRFMCPLRVNNSEVSKWADRPMPDWAWFGDDDKGIPWEWVIQIANETGKDAWINVPAMADDDYVVQLAAMFKAKLKPGLKVYTEWGNEMWNLSFHANKLRQEKIKNEADPVLNMPGSNYYHWAWFDTARKAARVATVFKQALGKDRVVGVLAGQDAQPAVIEYGLNWMVKNLPGKPSDYIDALAVAPYFGAGNAVQQDPNVTVDALVNGLAAHTSFANEGGVRGHKALASKYGLKLLAYEGGVDLGQYDIKVDTKKESQRDPRMEGVVKSYLNSWFDDGGGGLFMYFLLAGQYTKWGYWGLTENIRVQSPKYKGAAAVAAARQWDDHITPPPQTDPKDEQIKKLTAENGSLRNERDGLKAKIAAFKAAFNSLLGN